MTRYFAQNTPRAGLEHMMMSVPGFQKRGGGMMILSRFCYKPEDVDCRYCLHYRRRSCQVRTCPYIAERLKSGAIEYLDLILEYFGHIPHAGLHKRIQAVEHWSGPDQAVLHTVSVHLRSRFADRVNFDPDEVFGTNVASAFNDDWLNVYANFDWKTGRIDSALTVCLVCSDGHEFEFSYPLTPAEQVQLWDQMDAYCRQQSGQTLGETRTSLLREQAEEGLEIRL